MKSILNNTSSTLSPTIFAYAFGDLEQELVRQWSSSPQHARTLFARAYRYGQRRVMDPLPKRLSALLDDRFFREPVVVKTAACSRYDESVKFLLGLEDQRNVEMVLIPEKARITLCVSTQVGCRQACGFCHTGRMGLIRNLDAAEIVAQVTLANHFIAENPSWSKHSTSRRRVTNVVYMGMGEPMDNLSAVMKSIDILTDSRGLAIGLAKISVSTAGHIDGMREISAKYPRLPLAVSLHSPFDEQRSKLMPINKRYLLSNLVSLLESISVNHPVMIQYTLIKGVNDSLDHAHALVSLLRNCAVKINIIPLNEIEPTRFTGPSPESLTKFRNVLYDAGLRTMIRYSKGQDIYGACGQLIPLEKT